MKSLSSQIRNYHPQEPPATNRTVTRWQDYAAKVIAEFQIKKSTVRKLNVKSGEWEDKIMDWPGMIFRQAKRNLNYLEGKVAIAREKCAIEGGQIQNYGHYLISLFRAKKPWESKSIK